MNVAAVAADVSVVAAAEIVVAAVEIVVAEIVAEIVGAGEDGAVGIRSEERGGGEERRCRGPPDH